MAITKKTSTGHGSLRDLQELINYHPRLLNRLIIKDIPGLAADSIVWKSPLAAFGFAEYSDVDFLTLLGLSHFTGAFNSFWPPRGPQWDGLAKTKYGVILLVEAKANIPELVSPKTGASSNSKTLIDKALDDTKKYMGITDPLDWSYKFYQYFNRIAHLYFLRVKCNVPAFLLNIYFIGDNTVSGPNTKEEWLSAITVMKKYFGLENHNLSDFMVDIFIKVKITGSNYQFKSA